MAVANALPLPAAMKGTSSLLEWWMVIIILAREFMVTGIRLLAAGQGKVIAANKFGKVKTTLQFITILFLLAGGAVTLNGDGVNELQLWFVIVGKVLLVATLAITIFSGYEYLVKTGCIDITSLQRMDISFTVCINQLCTNGTNFFSYQCTKDL